MSVRSVASRDADSVLESTVLEHGGNIELAGKQFGVNPDDWIDLSTGISPLQYPNTSISKSSLHSLPYQNDAFTEAVKKYYGNRSFVAVNGSQQAIELLPQILKKLPIVLPNIGYKEHEAAWRRRGAEIITYSAKCVEDLEKVIDKLIDSDIAFHLLVINPNNPVAKMIEPEILSRLSSKLSDKGYLIVDEAFADLDPWNSILGTDMSSNTIVLRSFGKFFGLPGLRLGFVFADSSVCGKLKSETSVWDVNGPAQEIATRAFNDLNWQKETRAKLRHLAALNRLKWKPLIEMFRGRDDTFAEFHHDLFSSYELDSRLAKNVYKTFAAKGVLLRLIELEKNTSILRIGQINIEDSKQLNKLEEAIAQVIASLSLE